MKSINVFADMVTYCYAPYWGCEDDYGKAMFAAEDFEALADIMPTASSKVLISINDTPDIHRIFKGHQMEKVKVS